VRRVRRFSGDREASIQKAKELLTFAREEVAALRGDKTPRDRAKLRGAAEGGWVAISTAADAFLKKREGATAQSKADVFRAMGAAGAPREALNNAYAKLHIACHYNDDKYVCNIPAVRAGLREAGQVVHAVGLKLGAPSRGTGRRSPSARRGASRR
jgi:hypothetical protein